VRILLHTCCGPCTIYPLKYLREHDFEVTGYFYNPNIHPYTEWRKRRDTLAEYARDNDLPVIFDESYELEEFLRQAAYREGSRCRVCYHTRLKRAATVAGRGKFDYFTTTLLVSPFQKHELIREIGEEAARESGVPFYYADYRPGYKEATAISKDLGMYRQQYCGCIYSEKERYCRQGKKDADASRKEDN
jgi:predicted adenine nucleotide alpha hydrolase (AANH) superfamily ATPase